MKFNKTSKWLTQEDYDPTEDLYDRFNGLQSFSREHNRKIRRLSRTILYIVLLSLFGAALYLCTH